MFALPNGFPAYYAATSLSGARQAVSPLSCTTCHAIPGVIPKSDLVRDYALTTGSPDLETILTLYPPRSEISALIAADNARFLTARAATASHADPLTPLASAHAAPLDARTAAAALGLDEPTFLDLLAFAGPALPPDASALRHGRTIPRDTWSRLFPSLICALGLGTTCAPRDATSCSSD